MEIRRVHAENLFVYGADKVWAQLNREGITVARCTRGAADARERALPGPGGARPSRSPPHADDRSARPADLVDRDSSRRRHPNRLWVADLTYVKTHTGWVYVAFIIDVFSRFVVGWQASRSLRSRSRDRRLGDGRVEPPTSRRRPVELVHHSDRGVQYSVDPLLRAARRQRASSPRSDRRATATTTPWPSRSTGSTNGS